MVSLARGLRFIAKALQATTSELGVHDMNSSSSTSRINTCGCSTLLDNDADPEQHQGPPSEEVESIRTKPHRFERGSESFQPATVWDPAEKIAARENSPTLDNEGGNLGRFFGEHNHHYHLDSREELEHVDMEVDDQSSRPLQIQVNILSNNTNIIPTNFLNHELMMEMSRVHGFSDSNAEHHTP
ncbi:hypothetical protein THAOC_11743, partial [Thalassiosira oceanica]